MKAKTYKPKPCKWCKNIFTPERPIQPVCDYICALAYAKDMQIKKMRNAAKELLQDMKTKGTHLKEAEAIFNRFIRLRDKDQPCISCGTKDAKWDAGHFYSKGAYPNLRFNEDNCHKQCYACNRPLHGNIHEYSIRLKERIGPERYAALGNQRSTPLRLSIPEIIELKQVYRNKIKDLTR